MEVDTAYQASDLEVEPLGSPATSDYDGGLKFSEEGPLGDDPSDDTSRKDDSPVAHRMPYGTTQGPRKRVHPQPCLSLTTQVAIAEWVAVPPSPSPPLLPLSPLSSSSPLPSLAHSKPSRRRSRPSLTPLDSPQPSSPPCKRCKVSSYSTPSSAAPAELAAPASAELALTAPTLPSIPIDLLPSRKRQIGTTRMRMEMGMEATLIEEVPVGGPCTRLVNPHVKTVGFDVAYDMSWKDLMKMITELCPMMVPVEEDKVERYIWGLPDIIQGNVTLVGQELQQGWSLDQDL
nr:hypothetical protein [Tanacetum cinerariifolium]